MPQPSMTRAVSALTKASGSRCLVKFNPKVPSLGLTLATPWGPVDLVAIERAVRGHVVKLTAADYAWLRHRSHPAYGRDLAADRLGIDRVRFAELVRCWREENLPTTDTTTA